MRRRRELKREERVKNAALSAAAVLFAAAIMAMLITARSDLGAIDGVGGLVLVGVSLFYGASYALALFPARKSGTTPQSPPRIKEEPQDWNPPVNEEFERFGEAFFISVAPPFMPRWLVHANPRTAVANSLEAYSLIQLFRPAYFACASVATWCLRKSWTVAVERRNTAGAGEWRFVLREEYRSLADAFDRRTEIVNDWRDELLTDWRGGDYTARPFIDDETADRHDTTSPS